MKKYPMNLMHKMFLGYIALVLLPTLALFTYVMYSLSRQMLETEGERRQSAFTRAAASLEGDLARVETIQGMIQQNIWITEYLGYPYTNDWEPVYNYVKYIRPHIRNCMLVLPEVQNVKIYADPRCMPLGSTFASIGFVPIPSADLAEVRSGRLRWIMDEGGLRLYARVMDSDYTRILGILEVTVSDGLLFGFTGHAATYADAEAAVIGQPGAALYGEVPEAALLTPERDGFYREDGLLINRLWMERLKSWGVMVSPADPLTDVFSRYFTQNILMVSILLIVLSVFYASIMYGVTRRLLRLSRHIRNSDEATLTMYAGVPGNDEVGNLIEAYNHMIGRISSLIDKVRREEILRRSAEYDALQAKIEPHFLYGTLESIRMLAEESGARQVAETILHFVGLMRYSLVPDPESVTIGDEVENVRRYLRLQKLRYDDRLEYTIDVPDGIARMHCPQFILQPLVENSIQHGLNQRRGVVHIALEGRTEGGYVLLEVTDDGVSMEETRLKALREMLESSDSAITTKEGGYALRNINTRIQGFFGEQSGLVIRNRDGGGIAARLLLAKRGGEDELACS